MLRRKFGGKFSVKALGLDLDPEEVKSKFLEISNQLKVNQLIQNVEVSLHHSGVEGREITVESDDLFRLSETVN